MATKLITKHKTFLMSLLLFAFPTANSMRVEEVNKFCKETSEVKYCTKYLATDERIPGARNLNDLLVITISQCSFQVTYAFKELDRVRGKFSGPIGKERISICSKNYGYAVDLFHAAVIQANQKKLAYQAHLTALAGANYMRECEEEWKKNGRPQKSPVTLYNTNVAKLTSITRTIVDKLPPS